MTYTSQQIEAITQSVLRELNSRGVAVGGGRSLNGKPQAATNGARCDDASGLPLNEKVITEESLIAAAAAGRTISIPTGAIITPSGHDYIRRNGVTISNSSSSKTAETTGTVIVVGECSAATSAAATAGWKAVKAGCERDAASKARKSTGGPIVCCGGVASVTACLLNRDSGIRAAVVNTNSDIQNLTAAMQPNVLCLESAWAFSQLLKLLRGFSDSNAAPAEWKELSR